LHKNYKQFIWDKKTEKSEYSDNRAKTLPTVIRGEEVGGRVIAKLKRRAEV